MASLIPGYEYDIFISYRQKDNKGDKWVSEFVEELKGELESTFKEEISVYFDINPHDGLLETHDVDASLKEKLKCLVFIPIVSRTYCDPKSFAWEHEFKAFIEQASHDQFGLKVKLPNGNVAMGEELALKALKLDSTIAEVHAALAMAFLYRSWKYDESEKHFKRALELNPNLDMAHYHYSWGLLLWGRKDEAIKEHKLAKRYDPYNPLHTAWLGGVYDFAGRYQDAVNEALNSFRIQQDYPIGYLVLGRAYLHMGRNEEAIRMHQKLAELYPNQIAPLCLTYVATGHPEEAEKILAEIEKRPVNPLNAYNRARIYAKMGRIDEAFKWLAYEPHHSTVAWAAIIDDFELLHGDPRWNEFLNRVNLPGK